MTYNPDVHHRHSIRLRDFDYASTGAYYVTICTQGRICLFGDVVDGMMVENDAGRAVGKWWHELTKKFPFVEPDCFVAMPNHCHGIIYLVGADLRVRPDAGVGTAGHTHRYATTIGNRQIHAPTKGNQAITQAGAPLPDMPTTGGHTGPPLPTIMQWFKTMTTNEYMKNVVQSGWPPFSGRLWQRNYYERVIRNDAELDKFRSYILQNPARWSDDEENPEMIKQQSHR